MKRRIENKIVRQARRGRLYRKSTVKRMSLSAQLAYHMLRRMYHDGTVVEVGEMSLSIRR